MDPHDEAFDEPPQRVGDGGLLGEVGGDRSEDLGHRHLPGGPDGHRLHPAGVGSAVGAPVQFERDDEAARG